MKKFELTPEGFQRAKDFLLEIGKWNDSVHRLDGYEAVGIANKEIRKFSNDQVDFDTLGNGEYQPLYENDR